MKFEQYFPATRQANIFATGLLAILTLGTIALVVACIAAGWLAIQFCNLLLQSAVECLATIGQTYQSADPLVRFLILIAIAYGLYHMARAIAARKQVQS